LQREEHALPAGLPPELGDLAFYPERRQALEPRGDAAVEGRDGVDLAVAVEERFGPHDKNLARGAAPEARALKEDLCRDVGRAAAVRDEIDRRVEVGLALSDSLRKRQGIAGLDQDVQPPALDLAALVVDALDRRHGIHVALFLLPVDEPSRSKLGDCCARARIGARLDTIRSELP